MQAEGWMLDDGEVRGAITLAFIEGQLYGDDGQPFPEKAVSIAQHRRDVWWLEGKCPHGYYRRRRCDTCWAEFRKEGEKHAT